MRYINLIQKSMYKRDFYVTVVFEKSNGLIFKEKIFFENNILQQHHNIPVLDDEIQKIYLDMNVESSNFVDLYICAERIITEEQLEYDKRFAIKRHDKVNCSKTIVESSNKLIVLFPGYISLNSKIKFPITAISEITEANKLIFQDDVLTNGNYLTIDEYGNDIEAEVNIIIKEFIIENKIDESDVLFFGTSKGGSIALRIGKFYPKSTIVAVAPQLNVSYFFNDMYIFGNFHKNNLKNFFDKHGYDYKKRLNLKDDLATMDKNSQKVIIYTGTNDAYANSILSKYVIEENMSHNQVIAEQKDNYFKLIHNFINDKEVVVEYKLPKLDNYELKYKYVHVDFEYFGEIKSGQINFFIDKELYYTLCLPPGEDGFKGQFWNIVVPENTNLGVKVSGNNFKYTLENSNNTKYSNKVLDRNNDIDVLVVDNVKLYYKEKKVSNPKKVLFTFPGFLDYYASDQYVIYNLNQVADHDIIKIAYQDRYFVQGTYFTLDDNGNEILPSLVKHMKNTLKNYGLQESDAIIWGASKGATIAARLIPSFKNAKYILNVPQKDMMVYSKFRKDCNDLLLQYLSKNNYNYEKELDIRENLKLLDSKSLLIEAYNDYPSSIGFIQDNSENRYRHLILDLPHNSVTRISEPFWLPEIINFTSFDDVKFELLNFSVNNGEVQLDIISDELNTYNDYSCLWSYIEFNEINGNKKLITRIERADTKGVINIFKMGSYAEYIRKINEFFNSELVYVKIIVVVKNEKTKEITTGNVYKKNRKVILNIVTGDILV
jgi:hypothetical protein